MKLLTGKPRPVGGELHNASGGEAREIFGRAFSLIKDILLLGSCFFRKGQLKEAEAQYRKAILVKPDYVEVYNELGGILARQGKTEEAIGYFNKAIMLKPDF